MLDRRGFLKFIGGAAVGTLATPVVWKGLDDISIWSQNWSWIPSLEYGNNENTYVRTVSKLCPTAVGTRVRLVGGRPVRVLGDPEHPLSLGGISALAATEVQMRYSPARLKRPLKRGADGAYKAISWAEAEKLLIEKLGTARGKEGVVCISGDENGTMNELFSGFVSQMGSNKFFIMPGDAQATTAAWTMMGGKGRVGYDFAKSDHVFAIGANVLETWGTAICNRRAWGQARPVDGKPGMRLTYAGAVENNTAAGADTWLPIKPGTEGILLMGMAEQLILAGRTAPVTGFEAFKDAASKWTPEKVCAATGLAPKAFEALIKDLLKASAPLVIAGSPMDEGSGAAPILAGFMVNLLLGNLNKDGGLRAVPVADPVVPGAFSYADMFRQDLAAYADAVANGRALGGKAVIFYEANPVYALPGKGIDALFQKADFTVAFSCFFDETAACCDLVIPSALGLERYDDVANPFGYGEAIYALAQPVAEPLFESRAAGDVLISLAKSLKLNLGYDNVVNMLQAKAAKVGADWAALSEGTPFTSRHTVAVPGLFCQAEIIDRALALPAEEGKLALALVTKLAFGTPESALPPFNTKIVTPDELNKNVLTARINGATLKKLGLYSGQKIKLSNKAGAVEARVLQFEGVTNDTVALTMGFGHTAFGEFNTGKGMNVMSLLSAVTEPGTGLTVWTGARVNAAKA